MTKETLTKSREREAYLKNNYGCGSCQWSRLELYLYEVQKVLRGLCGAIYLEKEYENV